MREDGLRTGAIQEREDDPATLCGGRLDHYRIEDLVAQGGMANIFRATNLSTGEAVAIKIPHADVANDDQLLEGLDREERILQMLDHPGIVRVIREQGHSRPYMVMEWAEGRSLREVLNREGKLSAERAVKIAVSLCDALECIHRDGIVHRDLKPENILVDAEDHIKLIDFGIALTMASRRMTFSSFSRALGTPDYMAPEQVEAKREDRRSDLYSVGIILYEMVTGRVPFAGDTPLALMNARLLNDPPPARDFARSIPPQLERIIGRVLERHPKNRYRNAGEFARSLRQVHEPRTPVPVSPRTNEGAHSKRIWLYAAALIPLLILGLLVLEARREAGGPGPTAKQASACGVRGQARTPLS
jgi:serine/threonine protein kinase